MNIHHFSIGKYFCSEHLQCGGPCSFGIIMLVFGEVGPFQKFGGKLRNKGSEIIFKNPTKWDLTPAKWEHKKTTSLFSFYLAMSIRLNSMRFFSSTMSSVPSKFTWIRGGLQKVPSGNDSNGTCGSSIPAVMILYII